MVRRVALTLVNSSVELSDTIHVSYHLSERTDDKLCNMAVRKTPKDPLLVECIHNDAISIVGIRVIRRVDVELSITGNDAVVIGSKILECGVGVISLNDAVLAANIDRAGLLRRSHLQHDVDLKDVPIDGGDSRHIRGRLVSG